MKKQILVVDDEWSVLELLRFKLTREGFQVTTARNEKEFFEHIFKDKPDLLILDIWLGNEGGGTQLYDDALARGFNADVPVIFISALIEEGTLPKRASGRGRFALYGKPFNFEMLLEDIRHLTESPAKVNFDGTDKDGDNRMRHSDEQLQSGAGTPFRTAAKAQVGARKWI